MTVEDPASNYRWKGKGRARESRVAGLTDLPVELLNQIASDLTLPDAINFLSVHPAVRAMGRSNFNPLRRVVLNTLRAGPPYPRALAVLPSLHHLVGADADDASLWLDILVHAEPKWILESFEVGRWRDSVWEEAYARRFLPSWQRLKRGDDTWRAAFLRMLGYLQHSGGADRCHPETYTRFVVLNHDGSGTVNELPSRYFAPLPIFENIKRQQGCMEMLQTRARIVVQLQDVRIIALGVLTDRQPDKANRNAHLALHPPLLRQLGPEVPRRQSGTKRAEKSASIGYNNPVADRTSLMNALASRRLAQRRSLAQMIDTESTQGRVQTRQQVRAGRHSGPAIPTHRPSSDPDECPSSSWLPDQVTGPPAGCSMALPLEHLVDEDPITSSSARPTSQPEARPNTIPDLAHDTSACSSAYGERPTSSATVDNLRAAAQPYSPITRPTPAFSHRLYPNFTPYYGQRELRVIEGRRSTLVPAARDFRQDHAEMVDPDEPDEERDPQDPRMAERGDYTEPARWVGPMMLVAQVAPGTSKTVDLNEGPISDVDMRGPFMSIGREDVQALMPWLDVDMSDKDEIVTWPQQQ